MSEQLASIDELVAELRRGKPVIVVDDEMRENEGDIIIPAQTTTPEIIAFTIRYTGGVICLAMTEAHAAHLELPPMVQHNQARRGTAYTVSIEAAEGIETGISAKDRCTTIRATVREGVTSADLVRPGHVFPLRARDGGVLRRAGHTEAAVDLCRIAGYRPVGVVSELMHDDGTMMRLPAILEFARTHDLKVGTIADLIAYRLEKDSFVHHVASAKLPTMFGELMVHAFKDELNDNEHLAITAGDLRCDCGAQRTAALEQIAAAGRGVLVYLRQEGRGIGLLNKIKAYALQDKGADTVDANRELGLPPDLRDYGIGAQILHLLGVSRMRLMTNNPRKIAALHGYGLEIVERVPLAVGRNPHNERYLQTKADRLGHLLND